MRRYLQVRWSKNKGFYVENLFVVECESEDDLMAVLEEGRSQSQGQGHGAKVMESKSLQNERLYVSDETQHEKASLWGFRQGPT